MAYSEDQSLDNYVHMFEDIYEPIQNLERNFYQVFARLIESIAQCSQYVNKQNQNGMANNVPDVFSWYCSLVLKAKLKISLSEAIWKKFPYVCPYCLTAPCTCVRGKKKLEDNAIRIEEKAKENDNKKPYSLDDWQNMFEVIYPRDPQGYDQKSNFSHLIEEMGEVSEAYRVRYFHPTALENELADVFTWIIGIANLLNVYAKEGSINGLDKYSLQKSVMEKYNGICPKCKKIPCSCVSRDGRMKISELNVIYPNEILIAIEKLKSQISIDMMEIFKSAEGQKFLITIKTMINEKEVNEERIKSIVERLLTEPSNKKWYQKITGSGIAESAIVATITILVQQMLKL